jgi:uncharacterized protein (TIGR02147 family)
MLQCFLDAFFEKANDVFMTELDKASQILIKKYEEGRAKNARWSQRAFAKRLGLSSGALSEILQGKRNLTPQVKKKIASKLDLSPFEQVEFFEEELPNQLNQKRLQYHQLNNDQFHLIADWWHYAILNLIKTKGFKPLPSWISTRLGISMKITQEAWDRLFRMGHLKKVGQKVQREFPRLESPDDIVNLSVRRSHLEDLKLIENSLIEVPLELRDHTSMTIVMNKKDMVKAKEMIRLFQDKLSEEIEVNPGEEVYRLSISLFPLTKMKELE